MQPEVGDQRITVYFEDPVSGSDPDTGEVFLSSRHQVDAAQAMIHDDHLLFAGVGGDVVSRWPTVVVDRIVWVAHPTQHHAKEPDSFPVGTKEWLEAIKTVSPRAYEAWDDTEDEQLMRLFSSGATTKEMAVAHGRQPGAITSRLKKLDLT